MAAGKYDEVDAGTRKELGLGENDDVMAYCAELLFALKVDHLRTVIKAVQMRADRL